jgi:large subunit ribosomal protein L21
MYAIIDDRGNQMKVAQGEVVEIDLTDGEAGSEVVFDRVLLVSGEGGVRVGAPVVEGAMVIAEVVGDASGPKVYGMSFRRRKNSKVRKGHRQHYTSVRIKDIVA